MKYKDVIVRSGIIMVAWMLAACGTTAKFSNPMDRGEIVHWKQSAVEGDLKVTMHWVMPVLPGPHPTLVLNPGRGQNAEDLLGEAARFAGNGYLVVALDYERKIHGQFTTTMFPWRQQDDARLVLALIKSNPMVDRDRIAAVGYSLGGAHALLMAASTSGDIKAVVTYYPMTDFPAWRDEKEKSWIWRVVFSFVRESYNSESEQHNDATHNALLARYSAINYADVIHSPVLIIHGDDDGIAPLEYSRRLHNRLRSNGRSASDLLVVNGGDHAFNFKPSGNTEESWRIALGWLDRHLEPSVMAMNSVADKSRKSF